MAAKKTFADLKAPPKVESDDMIASHDAFALAVNKPLASLGLTVAYRSYPAFRKVVLDKDHPKVTLDDGQSFQLTALGDASASVRLSTPKMSTFVVQGLDDAGKALYSNGNNSRAFPSEGDIAALHDYYKALLQTKDDLKQLKTGQAVQQQLERLTQALAAQVGPLKKTPRSTINSRPPRNASSFMCSIRWKTTALSSPRSTTSWRSRRVTSLWTETPSATASSTRPASG
nr:hypothetical protein GCM10020185_70030 [Pseudomonas brassicacearum subsp. brassicacearum]